MVLAANSIEQMIDIAQKNWPLFLYGVEITLLFAVVGTVCGLILGLIIGGIRAVEIEEREKSVVKVIKHVLKFITGFYVWFVRGTPMMVQAMLFYYGLRPVLHWNPIVAGLCIISVNTGAYMAEIIRSGIQSIDKGQSEAARSLGMTSTQTMLCIIFPQAIKNSFPSIGNELIVNIKDSSMLNVISVVELYFQSASVAGSNSLFVPTFTITCILYLILTTLASWLMRYFENRLNRTKTGDTNQNKMKGSAV